MVRFEGVNDRDAALALGKPELWIERSELPVLAPGEHYRADLVGYEVTNLEGVHLGRVDRFLDFPANPVMVVVGERERRIAVVHALEPHDQPLAVDPALRGPQFAGRAIRPLGPPARVVEYLLPRLRE